MKKLFYVFLLVIVFIASFFITKKLIFNFPVGKDSENGAILREWLQQRDPNLFSRCKVFIPFETEGQLSSDEKYSIITGELCGGPGRFWINNKTKSVECYISFCGKNGGKKYCGDEIANNACEQK